MQEEKGIQGRKLEQKGAERRRTGIEWRMRSKIGWKKGLKGIEKEVEIIRGGKKKIEKQKQEKVQTNRINRRNKNGIKNIVQFRIEKYYSVRNYK